MEEQNVGPDPNQAPNADQRIADLERQLQDVNRRYAASSEEGKRLAQQLQSLQQPYVQPRPDIPQRDGWRTQLDSMGVPSHVVEQAIREEASQLFQTAFEPLQRGIQARQTMVGRYKDYNKFESDMMGYVNSDPELQSSYNRIFAADPVAAFDYAYLKFGQSQRKGNRGGGGDNAVQEDQVEAQIPSQRQGDARRIPQGKDAQVSELFRRFQDQPNRANKEAFVKARLGQVITDEFLNS